MKGLTLSFRAYYLNRLLRTPDSPALFLQLAELLTAVPLTLSRVRKEIVASLSHTKVMCRKRLARNECKMAAAIAFLLLFPTLVQCFQDTHG